MRIPTCIVIAAFLLTSCAEVRNHAPAELQDSAEEVTAVIQSTYVEMIEDMAAGNIAEMVQRTYTPDAIFHPPQASPAEGHDAIATAFSHILESGIKISPSPVYINVFGDVALEYGTGEITTPDGQVIVDTYIVLWKKSEGVWKMHRDFVSGTKP